MEIYRQGDERWRGMKLGDSPYQVGPYGCVSTCLAQALTIQNWNLTPRDVVDGLNRVGAYTDKSYSAGPGLLIWGKVANAFPQYHWYGNRDHRFQFVQVLVNSRQEHWLLHDTEAPDTWYDPIDGTTGLKGSYRATGKVYSADIDVAPTQRKIPEDLPWIVVTAEVARLREQPNTNSTILKKLYRGNELQYDKEENGWYHIWNGGWIRNDLANKK